jgi:hypothetical protein
MKKPIVLLARETLAVLLLDHHPRMSRLGVTKG